MFSRSIGGIRIDDEGNVALNPTVTDLEYTRHRSEVPRADLAIKCRTVDTCPRPSCSIIVVHFSLFVDFHHVIELRVDDAVDGLCQGRVELQLDAHVSRF